MSIVARHTPLLCRYLPGTKSDEEVFPLSDREVAFIKDGDEVWYPFDVRPSVHDRYSKYKIDSQLGFKTMQESIDNAKSWCCKRMSCMVIMIDNVSCSTDYSLIVSCFDEVVKYIVSDLKMFDCLAVLEHSPTKGYHCHILAITTHVVHKSVLTKWDTKYSQLECLMSDTNGYSSIPVHGKVFNVMCKSETIKSPASYFHYLKKSILRAWCTNMSLLKTFFAFERTFIFSEESAPKKFKANKHLATGGNDNLTILFFNLFNEGKLSYTECLKDMRMQNYLSNTQLKTVYTNCMQNFSSTFSHIQNLIWIIKKYRNLKPHLRCACPVIEMIHFQNHNINDFIKSMFMWLTCMSKKNCLWFFGPPNGGKSHFARSIWNCFNLNTRIISDGIYSFANLVNSGCALWDEPFISPDLADQTKLVLEGEHDINVTVKGLSSVALNKRVPILITSNSELSKYCSGERKAFEERCFRFDFLTPVDLDDFCCKTKHYCPNLDNQSGTINPFLRASNTSDIEREGYREDIPYETCHQIHPIDPNHALSFIFLVLKVCKRSFKLSDRLGSHEEYCELAELLEDLQTTLCYSSENFHLTHDEQTLVEPTNFDASSILEESTEHTEL